MTVHNTDLQAEFNGYSQLIEKTDVTQEEIEELFDDDIDTILDAFGMFEIIEIIYDNREEDYVYYKVSNYEPHFRIYRLEVKEE